MIQEFISIWETGKHRLAEQWAVTAPESYTDIVRQVVTLLSEDDTLTFMCQPDPDRITVIKDSKYQGTMLYVIAGGCDTYWSVAVAYGSCSSCDSFQRIAQSEYNEDGMPSAQQVSDYMTLALHIVQGIKLIHGG